ncbi:MAG: TolC family protein [Candidatus Solibacter usitatus]|nr:TolC family protein [Candidatus Solibacter usitatus]
MKTGFLASVLLLSLSPHSVRGQTAPQILTIDQAVEESLRNNLALMAEKQNVPISKAREIQAALRPNPVLNFAWDYLDWLGRGLTVANSAGPSEWSTHVDYIIEGPGKRPGRMALAKLATAVADLRLVDSIRILSLNVRLACVEYLLAKESVNLARQNLKVFSDIIQVNAARVKAGDLAGVELVRMRVAQQQFENSLRQAELRLLTAGNNLQQLIGRKSKDSSFDLAGALNERPAIVLLDELKTQALQQRPDLLAQRKDAERAAADTRLQKSLARPDYTASLMYHHQYGYSDGRTFGVYLQFPMPLYNRNQGEIERARLETRQTEMRSQALETLISTEVENACQQYASAWNLLERIKGSLMAEAKQVRDITEYSYRRGEASLLEFLDAQRAYIDAIQSYNEARGDYTKSLFLIDAVTGKSVTP